jgi:hypothetical protein
MYAIMALVQRQTGLLVTTSHVHRVRSFCLSTDDVAHSISGIGSDAGSYHDDRVLNDFMFKVVACGSLVFPHCFYYKEYMYIADMRRY